VKIAHLTTVDVSLRFLILPQLEAASRFGESIGISRPGEYVAELETRGIRHVPLRSSTRQTDLKADFRAMVELWSILREERPDILHTHNPKPGVYGRILGRVAGVPIVVNTVHGLYATSESPVPRRAIVYMLEGIASRFSDLELVQNPEDLELLAAKRIVAPSKLRLLGNGVDLERFSPEGARTGREAMRAELGLGDKDVAVGMVGRLVAEKGVGEFVEAARLVRTNATFFVIGPNDPDKGDAVGQQLLDAGRNAGVQFLGMRRDIDALYGALDVFVLPSYREGFPRAAMEAAASGLPLVLTDIRGCRQVVEDGSNGFLVPVRDPAAIAEAIQLLSEDPELRDRMGDASARKARVEFDEKKVVEIVMTAYRELADAKGLSWKWSEPRADIRVRAATVADADSIAWLHASQIETGFLSSLGPGFLRLVYNSLLRSDLGNVVVAESLGTVVGFVAGTSDTGAFYRKFARRNVLLASLRLLPALLRPQTWRRLWETLSYGSGEHAVSAELLSMAVAPSARRKGLGSSLVREFLSRAESQGVKRMRVVVGARNAPAISLYSGCGFVKRDAFELHAGDQSLEMLWSS
jgi:glycosyltransferase involved in cell wall biosynthesis/ribosomal protein S18 acetylase RimI-like enzyme